MNRIPVQKRMLLTTTASALVNVMLDLIPTLFLVPATLLSL